MNSISKAPLPNALFLGNMGNFNRVYAQGRKEKIAHLTNLYPDFIETNQLAKHLPHLSQIEVIFSTWGFPCLTAEQLDQLPSLKAVFYAAGSVREFATPLLERGITVVSAWMANAVPVAEFTLAQILLATKGFFTNIRENNSAAAHHTAFSGPGNFGETIALLGAGAIGRKVIELLQPFHLKIIVFDPFLSEVKAAELGVEKVTLDAAFERGYVVSNHLANIPETRGILEKRHFASLRQRATFINTGRGATIDENGMLEIFQTRPDLLALLDVTDPEPPAADSLIYSLPNVHLSNHIAGSIGDEVVRMADYCIEEFTAWQNGDPLRYAVTPAMLATMA